MRMYLLFILFLLGFINSDVSAIEEPTIIVRKEKKEIYKILPNTVNDKILFKSDRIIESVSFSPDNKTISFLNKDTIIIINFEGQVLHRIGGIDAIKKYSWSPDGRIAYLTFAQKDPDYTYKYPTGLWIFDMKTKEREKIAEKVINITWASIDTCIYLSYGRRIHKWDPKTKIIDTTNLKGYRDISFSPDGNYYSIFNAEVSPVGYRLLSSVDNEDITDQLIKTIGHKKHYLGDYPYPKWLKGTDHLLLFTKKIYEVENITEIIGLRKSVLSITNLIYNPAKDIIVKKFSGDPEKLKSNNYKLIYLIRNDSIVSEEIPKEYLK